jgi:LysR family transcriptional regulator of beta-lactamase
LLHYHFLNSVVIKRDEIHLNFTRAAIELCVSQGAVSHQVAQLERRLGTRLFYRLPRGLALTDDG